MRGTKFELDEQKASKLSDILEALKNFKINNKQIIQSKDKER